MLVHWLVHYVATLRGQTTVLPHQVVTAKTCVAADGTPASTATAHLAGQNAVHGLAQPSAASAALDLCDSSPDAAQEHRHHELLPPSTCVPVRFGRPAHHPAPRPACISAHDVPPPRIPVRALCPLDAASAPGRAQAPSGELRATTRSPPPAAPPQTCKPPSTPPRLDAAALPRWLRYAPPPPPRFGVPASQAVPHLPFVVDAFSATAQASGYRHFFLTHFHADHYKGLGKRFAAGTVYCTPETARLVRLKLRVRPGGVFNARHCSCEPA
jgi:hypothetical protein